MPDGSIPETSPDDDGAPAAGHANDPAADGPSGRSDRSRRTGWITKRRVVTGAVVIVLMAAAGVGTWLATRPTSASATVGPTVTTKVETVGTGTITQTVSASGTVAPTDDEDISFSVSGKVTGVDVAQGQKVTEGQTLATVDPTTLQATLTQTQATLSADESKLTEDQDNGASAAQIASDQATIASAQSSVTSAQTDVDDATLTSPISGTVATVNVSVGQQVSGSGSSGSSSTGSSSSGAGSSGSSSSSPSGSGSTGSATETASTSSGSSGSSSSSSSQFEIVSTDSYLVNATVDDTEVSQIAVGDQATITGTGASGNVFGTVSSVSLLAESSSDVAYFPIVVDVTGSPSGLYGGASATVAITTKQLDDVVEVPTDALSYSGSDTTVQVVANGSTTTRTVTTGTAANGETQITSGLSSGEKIKVREVTFRAGASGRSGSSGSSGGFPGGGSGFSGGSGGFPGGGSGFSGGSGSFSGGGGFSR